MARRRYTGVLAEPLSSPRKPTIACSGAQGADGVERYTHLPFELMAPEARALIVRVLAEAPHLRGQKLLDRIYGRATIPETIALDDWLCALPDHLFEGPR